MANTIKSLTVANIKKIEGMVRREDLDFNDDGNRFRGFAYKGMPITQCVADGTTYLSIRVDYLHNNFTHKEWSVSNGYRLEDEFNGVSSIDVDKLIANLEAIIAEVNEMNEKAANEVLDLKEVKQALRDEIMYAEDVVFDFKRNFKWYETESYKLNSLIKCMNSAIAEINKTKKTLEEIDAVEKIRQRRMIECLKDFGYVAISKDNYYLRNMMEALHK